MNDDKDTGRIEAFSDGVFAIAITLLILNIHTPPPPDNGADSHLLEALARQWPTYLSYAASFFFILVMWINHHRLFTVIRRSDNNLMILNGLLLLGVTVVPVPTDLVAQYLLTNDRVTAVAIYNGWCIIVAILFNLLWRYASYNNRLFTPKTDHALAAFITRQYAYGPIAYLVAVALTFVNPFIGIAISVGLAFFFLFPNRTFEKLMESNED
jgi:uncharacterized membrane protein